VLFCFRPHRMGTLHCDAAASVPALIYFVSSSIKADSGKELENKADPQSAKFVERLTQIAQMICKVANLSNVLSCNDTISYNATNEIKRNSSNSCVL
jgi:hypothetical protein